MAKTELHSEPLTPVDAAWLRMDSDTNNALIVGVMMFDQQLDFMRLRATLEYRLATVTRFHQRVRFSRNSSSQPNWKTTLILILTPISSASPCRHRAAIRHCKSS